MNRKHKTFASLIAPALLAAAAADAPAQTLIDQTAAMNGNVTPGDAAGFPVTLSQPGHYRLTGNLSVPLNVLAVEITAKDVTLDLNGFTISAPGSCSQSPTTLHVTCNMQPVYDGSMGDKSGIKASARDATVRNGTVRGFRGHGVLNVARLENMRIHDNRYHGFRTIYVLSGDAWQGTRIVQSEIFRNGSHGAYGWHLFVERSAIYGNGGHGIWTNGATVNDSFVAYNEDHGIASGGEFRTVVRGSNLGENKVGARTGQVFTAGGNWDGTSSF